MCVHTRYVQTGPLLPDDASEDSLFEDLRPHWRAIDGDTLRTEAYDYVDGLWGDGLIGSWADAQGLIEDHVPHPVMEEGLEAVAWDVIEDDPAPEDDDDDDDGDDEDHDPSGGAGDDDDGGGGGAVGGEGGVDGKPAGEGGDGDDGDGAGPSGHRVGAGGSVGGAPVTSCALVASGAKDVETFDCEDRPAAWGGVCTDPAYLAALDAVIEVAKQTRNDSFLKRLQKERATTFGKITLASCPQAQKLRKLAAEERSATEAARREKKDAERKATMEDLEARRELERVRRSTVVARREALEVAAKLRAEDAARREREARARRDARWFRLGRDFLCSMGPFSSLSYFRTYVRT